MLAEGGGGTEGPVMPFHLLEQVLDVPVICRTSQSAYRQIRLFVNILLGFLK